MTDEIKLQTQNREMTGKKVRRLRREGWTPAIVYGTGRESLPIKILEADLVDVLKQAGTSVLIGLQLEKEDEPLPAFVREIQRDPLSREILHVDFELVDMSRPITAQVPIVTLGQSSVVDDGIGVLTRALQEVEVHCLPADVPSSIEIDLSIIQRPDQTYTVGDLQLPDKVQILTDPEAVILYVSRLRAIVEEEVVEEIEGLEEEAVEGEEVAEGLEESESEEE
jgi:large subunit ribosomal protein L25